MSQPITAVLIHGAWANASSWSSVILGLHKRGIPSIAVQLGLTTVDDDVATVHRALALIEGPVVLVSHSYGGVVATVAGNSPKVKSLVYVAAFAPDSNEGAGTLLASVEPSPVLSTVVPDAQGYLKLSYVGVSENFAQDLPEADLLLAYATQGPTSAKALEGTVEVPAWKNKPSRYIVAEHDRAIPPALQHTMADRAGSTKLVVAGSHLIMLSQSEAVSDVILAATST